MERDVGVDRARDVDLRGPGDAPPDYRGARQRALLSTTNSKPVEMPTTTAGNVEREAARPRGRGALGPVTSCGLMLRL